jgi:hypothetical protein
MNKKKYKCRVEAFIDICNFFTEVCNYNLNNEEKIYIFGNKINTIENYEIEYEFESNIIDCSILKQIMYDINYDLHIMYQTLEPIEKYTGETIMFEPIISKYKILQNGSR